MLRSFDPSLGIRFPPPPKANIVYIPDSSHTAEEILKRSVDIGGNTFGSRPEIVFWIFDKANDPNYHHFKAFGKSKSPAALSTLAHMRDFRHA